MLLFHQDVSFLENQLYDAFIFTSCKLPTIFQVKKKCHHTHKAREMEESTQIRTLYDDSGQ
jgi:hypothetical protein